MLFSDFDLFMITQGRMGVVWPDGSRSIATRGTFVLIPPMVPVRVMPLSGRLGYWFCHFNFRLAPPRLHRRLASDYLGPAAEVSVPTTFTTEQAPQVRAAYQRLAALRFQQGDPPYRFESALLRLVGELKHFGWKHLKSGGHHPGPSSFQDRRLATVLARIRSQPQARWKIAELAASVGLSPDRLNTLCRRFTFKSVKQHVIEARFQLAFDLLRQHSEERPSVKEVSARCGFASQHFFCRLFKRRFRLTPSQFRDSTIMT
jgi:AraC-like DNA-binding protein